MQRFTLLLLAFIFSRVFCMTTFISRTAKIPPVHIRIRVPQNYHRQPLISRLISRSFTLLGITG